MRQLRSYMKVLFIAALKSSLRSKSLRCLCAFSRIRGYHAAAIMSSGNFDADVLVVGGGLAGMRAAANLKAGGVSVLVLEARDRLGGRTYTRPLGGAAFDFGGQFIGPGQPRMYELVKDLELGLAPTPVAGRRVLELGG